MIRIHAMCPGARTMLLSASLGLLGSAGCDPGKEGDPPELRVFHASVPSDFVKHESRVGDVSLRTPKSWKEISTSGVVGLYLRTNRPTSSVSLVVAPRTSGESLATTMVNLPEDLKHEFADFELVDSDLVVVNDLPAGRIIYEGSRGGFHGRLMAVLIDKGGDTYILTYTAAPEDFEEELGLFESVLASMELN